MKNNKQSFVNSPHFIEPTVLMDEYDKRLHDPDMVANRVAHFLYIEQQKMLSKHKEILTVIKGD